MRHAQLPLRNEWVYEATGPQVGLLLALVAVMSWVFMPNTVSAQNSYPATRVPGAAQSAPGVIPATRPGQGAGGGGIIPATRIPGQIPGQQDCFNNQRCFGGFDVQKNSYGSYATIDTANPYISLSGASFELLETFSIVPGDIVMMQIGWAKSSACPDRTVPFVFTEYYVNKQYQNQCVIATPNGKNSYYETIKNGNAWCSGYNESVCLQLVPISQLPMNPGQYVGLYGETTDPSVQMGGPDANSAVYLSEACVKSTSSSTTCDQSLSTSDPITQHGSCGANPCPYGYDYGANATSGHLYVKNWTR